MKGIMGEGDGTNFVNGMIVFLIGSVMAGFGIGAGLTLPLVLGLAVQLTGSVIALMAIDSYMNTRSRT